MYYSALRWLGLHLCRGVIGQFTEFPSHLGSTSFDYASDKVVKSDCCRFRLWSLLLLLLRLILLRILVPPQNRLLYRYTFTLTVYIKVAHRKLLVKSRIRPIWTLLECLIDSSMLTRAWKFQLPLTVERSLKGLKIALVFQCLWEMEEPGLRSLGWPQILIALTFGY